MSPKRVLKKIIERGQFEDQNQFEKRRGQFFNIILLFITVSTLIMVFVAHNNTSKLLNVIGVIAFLLLYYMQGFKPKLASLFLGLVYQAFIFLHSSVLDIGGQVEYGALAMTIILPVFYKRKVALYFLLTNAIIFYYPYLILDAYQSFFKLSYVFAIGLFFTLRAFVRENETHEIALIKKQDELKELNKHKNHLIQVVAHDLKSPLNQVEGLVGLIKISDAEAIKKEGYLGKIEKSVNHMSGMITRILDVEKIENREPVKLEKVNLIPILKAALESFNELANNKKIIINQLLPESDVWIKGNIHYLNQIFYNLLSNAIKFSEKEKVVKVVVEQSSDSTIINIIDAGPGISVLDQEKLFMKFQKLSAKPTNNEGSTGLGLALTKSFVEALNGSITCTSKLGSGTTFSVEFKVA